MLVNPIAFQWRVKIFSTIFQKLRFEDLAIMVVYILKIFHVQVKLCFVIIMYIDRVIRRFKMLVFYLHYQKSMNFLKCVSLYIPLYIALLPFCVDFRMMWHIGYLDSALPQQISKLIFFTGELHCGLFKYILNALGI